ncbi:hypothetical protein DXG01_002338, partial [Tephrocybe rancida]
PTVPAAAPTGVPTPAPITANVEAPVPMDAQAVALGTHGSGIADVNNKRYYIVTVGRGIGVFDNWNETSNYVTGAPGSTFSMFAKGPGAHNKAMRAFNAAFASGSYNIV